MFKVEITADQNGLASIVEALTKTGAVRDLRIVAMNPAPAPSTNGTGNTLRDQVLSYAQGTTDGRITFGEVKRLAGVHGWAPKSAGACLSKMLKLKDVKRIDHGVYQVLT